MDICIALPCINRPNIVELCISTLVKHLKDVDFNKSSIFINIDPVPIYNNRDNIEKIIKKYIGNVYANYTSKPSYPKAYIHVLREASNNNNNNKNNIVLFCPDDWKFVKDFSIKNVIKRLDINSGVKSVAINNNWEHGNFFGNSKGKHKSNERGCFRSTPAFYDLSFVKSFIDNIEAIPCPLEKSLNKKYLNKNNSYSLWLSDKYEYFCEDTGIKWREENNIYHSMIHKCGRYKLCLYCGNVKWKYICCNKNGEKCKDCDVICSKKCWDTHCDLFHKENKDQYQLLDIKKSN